MAHPRWIALVARTPADARDYMIEGPGGILRNTPPWERPLYEPSKRRLLWPNGSWATIYSDEEPDQVRGFSGDTAWIDEFGKFRNAKDTWDNLQFGMREASSDRPRRLITTTPRPIPALREIRALASTVTVYGSSYENRGNLDPTWFAETLSVYEGTALGRREIHGEDIDDVTGALWKRSTIDQFRILPTDLPDLVQIIVALDPEAVSTEDSAETGIMAGGIDANGHGYLLADASLRATPAGWGKAAVELYHALDADEIVGEGNNGGEMVEHTIRTVDPKVRYSMVWASRGKHTRAQPVSSLYEQGLIHHVGSFPEVEDQMCNWIPGDKSPDRMDALVWLFTKLFRLDKRAKERRVAQIVFPGMKSPEQRRFRMPRPRI